MDEKEEREQTQNKMDQVLSSLSKLTQKNKVIPIKQINFTLLDDDRYEQFCYQLRHNEYIKQLWINNCRFSHISIERWRAFCQAIRANSTIRILTFHHTCLFEITDLGKEYWEEFTSLFNADNYIDDKDNSIDRPDKLVASDAEKNITDERMGGIKIDLADESMGGKKRDLADESMGGIKKDLTGESIVGIRKDPTDESIGGTKRDLTNTHISFLELFKTHIGNIDEQSWIAFCKAIQSSATLRFLSISGQDLMKLSQYETGWAVFCKMLQMHSSIQSLQIMGDFHLPISPWLRFFSAIQNNQILKYLKFENCHLWYLSNEHVDALLKIIEAHPSLIKLSLLGSKINLLSEERWEILCNAIQFNRNLKTLKLEKNHLNLITLNQWQKFCKAIAQNRSLTKLFLSGNGIGNVPDTRWRIFLQAVIDHIQLNSVDIGSKRIKSIKNSFIHPSLLIEESIHTSYFGRYLISLDTTSSNSSSNSPKVQPFSSNEMQKINQRIEKSLAEYSEFEITRGDKLESLLDIKRKFRKASTLALGHSLYAFRLKRNDLHTRFFSKRIITHILTYFESKDLTDHILIEVERHLERVRIEKAKLSPKPDSIAEISEDDKKNKSTSAKKRGCVIC